MDIYFIGINDNILQTQNNFCGSITVERNFNTKIIFVLRIFIPTNLWITIILGIILLLTFFMIFIKNLKKLLIPTT